jgi:hypothetical protein
MARIGIAIAAIPVVGIAGFLIGRETAPAVARTTATGAAPTAETARERVPEPRAPDGAHGAPPTTSSSAPGSQPAVVQATGSTAPGSAGDGACATDLQAAREAAAAEADERAAREGVAIPMPATTEPRFAGVTMSGALTKAMKQAKKRGGVDGVDCSEYPCIVYGRINGSEDDLEPIEQSPALRPYRDDISTILLWAQTDEAAEDAEGEHEGAENEQLLYAFTYYSRADAAAQGDDLDRRIRWRATELWASAAPSDESGPSR